MTNYKLTSLEESMAHLGLSVAKEDQEDAGEMWQLEEVTGRFKLDVLDEDEDEDEDVDEDELDEEDGGIALLSLLEKRKAKKKSSGKVLDPETGKAISKSALEKKNLKKWLEANPGKSPGDYKKEKKEAAKAARRRPKKKRRVSAAKKRARKKARARAGLDHDTDQAAEPTGVERLDLLMSQLEDLTETKKPKAEEEITVEPTMDEDRARLVRIYANIASIADELAGRIDEAHELHGKFDELADDALQIGEALRDGKITVEKAKNAVEGYVNDLAEAMEPIAGELEEELEAEDEDETEE